MPAALGAFNPTPANIAAVAAHSVWPAATTYGLSQWPPARDFTQAAAYCGKTCGSQTLAYGDQRWVAGNGAFINGELWRAPSATRALLSAALTLPAL